MISVDSHGRIATLLASGKERRVSVRDAQGRWGTSFPAPRGFDPIRVTGAAAAGESTLDLVETGRVVLTTTRCDQASCTITLWRHAPTPGPWRSVAPLTVRVTTPMPTQILQVNRASGSAAAVDVDPATRAVHTFTLDATGEAWSAPIDLPAPPQALTVRAMIATNARGDLMVGASTTTSANGGWAAAVAVRPAGTAAFGPWATLLEGASDPAEFEQALRSLTVTDAGVGVALVGDLDSFWLLGATRPVNGAWSTPRRLLFGESNTPSGGTLGRGRYLVAPWDVHFGPGDNGAGSINLDTTTETWSLNPSFRAGRLRPTDTGLYGGVNVAIADDGTGVAIATDSGVTRLQSYRPA